MRELQSIGACHSQSNKKRFSMCSAQASTSDRAILLAFRLANDLLVPIGPPWLVESAKDISALGGTTVISLLTAAAVGFLALHRQ